MGIFISISKNFAGALKQKTELLSIELEDSSDIEKDNESKEKENPNELELDDFLLNLHLISFELYQYESKHLVNKFILAGQTPIEKLTPPPKTSV